MTTNRPAARGRWWLCLAPTAACWADVTATLVGQGRPYWNCGFARVTEFNPLARVLLSVHPAAFVAAACVSTVLVAAFIRYANRPLALCASFVVTFCHAVAAACWLLRASPWGVIPALVVLAAFERLLSWSWQRGRAAPRPLTSSPTSPIGI
jgi:hypothetical protein